MAVNLIRVNPLEPCEVCNGDHDCSRSPDGNVHCCRRIHQDTDDFKCVGHKNGFSSFVRPYRMDIGHAKKQFIKYVKSQPEIFTVSLVKEELAELLTKVFSFDSGNLHLKDHHFKAILARGLSEDKIKSLGFFSVTKGEIIKGANASCPGFNSQGKWCGDTGFAIPTRDFEGRITGYQIRPDYIPPKGAKYKWAVGYENGDAVNSSHISLNIKKERELPLTFESGEDTSGVLYLCEGTYKPKIIAHKFKINVLGASSGLHASSPQQFEDLLEKFKPRYIVFLPDAGTILNNGNVCASINSAIDFLNNSPSSKYYENRIFLKDWGQLEVSKDNPLDADEVVYDQFVGGRNLTASEFNILREQYLESIKTQEETANNLVRDLNVLIRTIQGSASENAVNPTPSYLKKDNLVPYSGCLTRYLDTKIRGRNAVTIKPEERLAFQQEAVNLGFKYILDLSTTGSSKSYTVGLMKVTDFVLPNGEHPKRIWSVTTQSRKPTTTTIEENYVPLPAKNAYLEIHPTDRTPLGNKVAVRDAGEGVVEIQPGNCSMYEKIEHLQESNIKQNFCKDCHLVGKCASEHEPGSHGYLFLKKQALESENISAHIAGVNPKDIEEGGNIAFFDEASRVLSVNNEYKVSYSNLQNLLYLFEQDKFLAGIIALEKLMKVAKDNSKFTGKSKLYGIGVQEYFDITGGADESLIHVATYASDLVSKHNKGLISRGNKKLMPEFCSPLFRCLSGLDLTLSLSIHNGLITIVERDDVTLENISHFDSIICQDATWTRELMAQTLGIDPEMILVFCQEENPENRADVNINQISALGKVGSIRSTKVLESIEVVWDFVCRRHKNVGRIDWKKYNKEGLGLNHCSDGRGSNRFEKHDAIVIYGLANMNKSAAIREFEVLFGERLTTKNEAKFKIFYTQKWQSELLQEVGRIRSSRRKGEILEVYVVTSEDISYLEDHGHRVIQVSGYEIDPELELPKDKIMRRLLQLKLSGAEFSGYSVRGLAKLIDCPSSTLHDLFDKFSRSLSAVPGYEEGDIGKRADILVGFLMKEPAIILYYTAKVLATTSDPVLRKQVVSASLKFLALIKISTKKFIMDEQKRVAAMLERERRLSLQKQSEQILI